MIEKNEIIVRELSDIKKQGKTLEAFGLIHADIERIYKVLTNFEDYPTFMPNLGKVEILKKSSNHAVLNYFIELPLGKTKKYRLDMRFNQNSNNTAELHWKMISWPGLKQSETIKDTTGNWHLRAYPDKQGSVLVVYHVYTDPGPIPYGLGWIIDILTEKSVPNVLINTRKRVYEIEH